MKEKQNRQHRDWPVTMRVGHVPRQTALAVGRMRSLPAGDHYHANSLETSANVRLLLLPAVVVPPPIT